MKIGRIATLFAALVIAQYAEADGPRTIVIRTVSPEQAFKEHWARGDHAGALDHLERALRSRPNDPLLYYNRACAKAQLGQPDLAAESLMDALRNGFNAFSHMQRDPDLAPIREHRTYQTILRARRAADGILAQRRLNEWRAKLGENAAEATDDSQRLHYLAQMDDASLDLVRRGIELHLSLLNDLLFDDPPGLWCLVALPEEKHRDRLLRRSHVYGSYRHNAGLLIALDREVALRHELVHLLHHRHMDELGQQHPIWIQEGLAVLFERYEIDPSGLIRFQPGTRRNIAKKLASDDRLLSWSTLFALDDRTFNRESHRLYAQVDAMFRFVADEGDLSMWYHNYVEHFKDDPTGRLAFERQFDAPIGEIESRWREWLDAQPFHITNEEIAVRGGRSND